MKIGGETDFRDQMRSIARKVFRQERPTPSTFKSAIVSSYTSGNPATVRPGEGSGGASATKKVLAVYRTIEPAANQETIEGKASDGSSVVLGAIVDLSAASEPKRIGLPLGEIPWSGQSLVVGTAGEVRAWNFQMPKTKTVTKIAFQNGVGAVGSNVGIAIYDDAGTTRLITSGAKDGTTSGTIHETSVSSVKLIKDVYYWLAWTSDSSTLKIVAAPYQLPFVADPTGGGTQDGQARGSISSIHNDLEDWGLRAYSGETTNTIENSQSDKMVIVAGNTSSGGVPPTTLGTLTTAGNFACPIVYFF